MGYCAAPCCKNKSTDGIRLFRFPRDKKRQDQWVQNCKRDKWQPTYNSKLCEHHFEESQFEQNRADGRKLLKWNAVPTLFNMPSPLESVHCKRKSTEERQLPFQRSNKAAVDEAGSSAMVEGEEYYNAEEGEWLEKLDTGQLCRICANPNEYLIPIFEGEGLEHELALKIKKHLPIEVSEADTLPRQVCYQCASTLIAWHDLVICCVEADKKLQELQAEENQDDQTAEAFEAESYDSDIAEGTAEHKEDIADGKEPDKTTKPPTKRTSHLAKEKKSKQKSLVESSGLEKSTELVESVSQEEKASESTKPNEGASQESSERLQHCSAQLGDESSGNAEDCEEIKYMVSESPFFCMYCPEGFVNESLLVNHLCCCHLTDLHHCEICDEYFHISKEDFSAHVSEHNTILTLEDINSIKEGLSCGTQNVTESSMNKELQSLEVNTEAIKAYSCGFCGIISKCEEEFASHLKVHIIREPIKCSFCESTFKTLLEMKTHEREHKNEKPFHCKFCEAKFASTTELLKHSSYHRNGPDFVCKTCGKKLKSFTDFKFHTEVHKHRYKCMVCNKAFRDYTSLMRHLDVHQSGAMYVCEKCGKEYRSESHFLDHLKLHTGYKSLMCHRCGKNFYNLHSLQRHLQCHSNQQHFMCSKCGQKFRWYKNLAAHNKVHDAEYGAEAICDVCGKQLSNKDKLKIHMRTHTGEKPYACEHCDKRFTQKPNLNYHVSTKHGGPLNHVCDICQSRFPSKQACDNHRRIHTGECPYKCTMCPMSFRSTNCLYAHTKIHLNIRSYVCGTCQKKFAKKSQLDSHLRTHTGERPFICNICGKAYTQKWNMVKHRRSHEGSQQTSTSQSSTVLENFQHAQN